MDLIADISWDMQLLQELFSTGIQNRILLFTEPIMFGLMNIIIVSPYNTSTLKVLYYFNNILKVLFIIKTSSTWFHVNLILHPLHLMIHQFSHMKLSYLPLERKSVLFYLIMNILQFLISLIQSQIHQPVINFQHRLRNMCASLISTEKSLSHLNVHLMNSIAIKTLVGNPSSSLVYAKGRATIEQILKRFDIYLIKSYLWFQILKFFSQRNIPHQRTLLKV